MAAQIPSTVAKFKGACKTCSASWDVGATIHKVNAHWCSNLNCGIPGNQTGGAVPKPNDAYLMQRQQEIRAKAAATEQPGAHFAPEETTRLTREIEEIYALGKLVEQTLKRHDPAPSAPLVGLITKMVWQAREARK